MIADFIITFRETLEAALIVGIVLSYLKKTQLTKYNNMVYMGIATGVIASIIGAILFNLLAGGFTGIAEQMFEGVVMLFGAFLLTTAIIWMMKQRHLSENIERKIATSLNTAQKSGLFFIVFVSVLREGIETVIFLRASSFVSGGNSLLLASLGLIGAVLLGYLLFVTTVKIRLKLFFKITSILLILFAAGLVAHGVHELQEAQILPIYIEHVWDINPAVNADGSFPLFHEKGLIGEFMKGLFGYNGNPSLIEVLSYLAYIILVTFLWQNINLTYVKVRR